MSSKRVITLLSKCEAPSDTIGEQCSYLGAGSHVVNMVPNRQKSLLHI